MPGIAPSRIFVFDIAPSAMNSSVIAQGDIKHSLGSVVVTEQGPSVKPRSKVFPLLKEVEI